MHFEQSAILTVHNHVITRNPRISVTHDKHDKYKTWFLHIANVQEEDKGRYMCQINTVTAKTQFGYVHVVGKKFIGIFFVVDFKILRMKKYFADRSVQEKLLKNNFNYLEFNDLFLYLSC